MTSEATGVELGGAITSGFGSGDAVTPSGGWSAAGANGTGPTPAFFTGDGGHTAEVWILGALGGCGTVLWMIGFCF